MGLGLAGELGGGGLVGIEFEGGFELLGELGAGAEGVVAEAAEEATAFGFDGLGDREVGDALFCVGEWGEGDGLALVEALEVLLEAGMVGGVGFDAGAVGGVFSEEVSEDSV